MSVPSDATPDDFRRGKFHRSLPKKVPLRFIYLLPSTNILFLHKEEKNPKMTAENVISANVRMGRPPFDYAEWARERMTEKYGITPENEAEVAAKIHAEEDARWATNMQEAKERKRKAEAPPEASPAAEVVAEAVPPAQEGAEIERKIKFIRNGPLENDAKHGVASAFQAYMKPIQETLEKLEAKVETFKENDFAHHMYSGDVFDLKNQMEENLAMRKEAFGAITAVFEHFSAMGNLFCDI